MSIVTNVVGNSVSNLDWAKGSATGTIGANAMGKEDFTKLLITQIQHQNPLQPMSNTEFVAQLAQFSSLEQLTLANSNLEQLLLSQYYLNRVQAATMLGKEIEAEGNVVILPSDSPAQLSYRLFGDASTTRVYIYNDQFDLVRTIQVGAQFAGEHSVEWDGGDSQGVKQPAGNYSFMVEASDARGNRVSADTFITGKVTGLSYRGGMVNLLVGDVEIPLGELVLVKDSE